MIAISLEHLMEMKPVMPQLASATVKLMSEVGIQAVCQVFLHHTFVDTCYMSCAFQLHSVRGDDLKKKKTMILHL